MAELQRVDQVTEPLVKGHFYFVPTVWANWIGHAPRHWPVIGTMHTDPEFFNFAEPHFHIDGRFVAQRYHHSAYFTPLTRPYGAMARREPGFVTPGPPLPKPVLKRRKCIHPHIAYSIYPDEPAKMPTEITDLRAAYSDTQCKRGKGGWICPHRKASLGSVVPVDGVITCPLHGLRIDAANGKVLSSKPQVNRIENPQAVPSA